MGIRTFRQSPMSIIITLGFIIFNNYFKFAYRPPATKYKINLMKTKILLVSISFLCLKSYAQEIELRHLENIEIWVERNMSENHILKGTPSKVTYTNYEFNNQSQTFTEDLSIFLNLYRNSTYYIDSIGRVKHRTLLIYGNRDGADNYHYQEKPNQQTELFIERYWWKDKDNAQTEKELRLRIKEIYHNGLLVKRFDYEREIVFKYDEKDNLTDLALNIYKEPHQYNDEGDIVNLIDNTIIESKIMFSYTYDDKNRRKQKKEINSEYLTDVTRYLYDKDDRLIKKVLLSYHDNELSYIAATTYKYNAEGYVSELMEFLKNTIYDPISGTEEDYIQKYLTFIEANPDYYKEHKIYTYSYDSYGNWISKTFYDTTSGNDPIYKLTRQIDYK